jgi:hypothetical protein
MSISAYQHMSISAQQGQGTKWAEKMKPIERMPTHSGLSMPHTGQKEIMKRSKKSTPKAVSREEEVEMYVCICVCVYVCMCVCVFVLVVFFSAISLQC